MYGKPLHHLFVERFCQYGLSLRLKLLKGHPPVNFTFTKTPGCIFLVVLYLFTGE